MQKVLVGLHVQQIFGFLHKGVIPVVCSVVFCYFF